MPRERMYRTSRLISPGEKNGSVAGYPELLEITGHPVEILHQKAMKDFQELLSRQSRTVEEAIEEYTRRYERAPPPGFDDWVKYAQVQQSPIIDDFDMILENLEPFYRLEPQAVRQLMEDVTRGNNTAVTLCSYTKRKGFQNCGRFGETMGSILGKAKKRLPDMVFPLNLLDEPSVLLSGGEDDDTALDWPDLAHQSIVDEVTAACVHKGHASTTKPAANRIETYGLPFVQNVEEEKNLCLHPEYEDQHGFLNSPTSFRRLGRAAPLVSRAAPYPFADVLMPSPHYAFRNNLYNRWSDRPWHKKKNAVFWHGSTTGGYWHKGASWMAGHRQRFTALTTMPGPANRTFSYLEPSHHHHTGRSNDTSAPRDHPYRRRSSPSLDHTLFDVHISRILQCDPEQCSQQSSFFHTPASSPSPPPASRQYRYRLAFDIDGNSYSGRFHQHLAGHTTPLKMSIFREWHDERLVPWLHYVPVSTGMEELPELVRFLTGTVAGRGVAERVAEEGRGWYDRAVGPVHQGLYLYRLLLELGWLQDPARVVVV
ncbi:hypothetical protein SLS53_004817 [Cytospora paraplurivora]|uniref:Glycosyl transferase CAP10 domain-containing protein n=1 Tax=Cytospora paraplurivora TaxID=2898453 RepID=A0AAN9U6W9_9PEZI